MSGDHQRKDIGVPEQPARTERTAVVLSHNLTDNTTSISAWASALRAGGHTVATPNHPRNRDDQPTSWHQLARAYEHTYLTLTHTHDHVYAGGTGLGATLALWLAERHDPTGLLLVNPAVTDPQRNSRLHTLRTRLTHTLTTTSGPDTHAANELSTLTAHVRRRIHTITTPALLLHTATEHAADTEWLHNHLPSPITDTPLNDCHDPDTADIIHTASLTFITTTCPATGNTVTRT